MMYNLYNAGQTASKQLGLGGSYPTTNTVGGIHYADHLVDRHVVLPFIFDAKSKPHYGAFVSEVPEALVTGDVINTQYLYAGTRVHSIVVHNKAVSTAKLTIKLVNATTGATIGSTTASADLSDVGFTVKAFPVSILPEDTLVQVTIDSGDLRSSCFSTFVELTYYNDDHQCSCARPACDVTFPEPMCS